MPYLLIGTRFGRTWCTSNMVYRKNQSLMAAAGLRQQLMLLLLLAIIHVAWTAAGGSPQQERLNKAKGATGQTASITLQAVGALAAPGRQLHAIPAGLRKFTGVRFETSVRAQASMVRVHGEQLIDWALITATTPIIY